MQNRLLYIGILIAISALATSCRTGNIQESYHTGDMQAVRPESPVFYYPEIVSKQWEGPGGRRLSFVGNQRINPGQIDEMLIAKFGAPAAEEIWCLEFYLVIDDHPLDPEKRYVLLGRDWWPPDRGWTESMVKSVSPGSGDRTNGAVISVTRKQTGLESATDRSILYFYDFNVDGLFKFHVDNFSEWILLDN